MMLIPTESLPWQLLLIAKGRVLHYEIVSYLFYRIISGGSEGEVRIWRIGRQTQVMEASMKEHRGRVWSIQIRKNNDQAVSASADGSCIIWDIKTFTRLTCLFESTLFKQVLYHPEESQLLTTGSDRKVAFNPKWPNITNMTDYLLDYLRWSSH